MAAKAVPYQYLKGSLAQGSADAFVQGSITTGLSGLTKSCYRVKELVVRLPTQQAATGTTLEFAFSRKSVTAVPLVSDKNCIFKWERFLYTVTSGYTFDDLTWRWLFPGDEFIIVEDPLYLAFDSNATTATNTMYYSIAYEEAAISEDVRLNLLVNSLI